MLRFRSLSLPIFLFLFGLVPLWLGCGGSSSPENPVDIDDEDDDLDTDSQEQVLNVNMKVSKTAVKPGETVTLTATVDAIRGTDVLFNWVNVTGYGAIPDTNENSVVWTAPTTLDRAQVQVEVIQLIVTAIIQVVSVKESGVDTDTEVLTSTKTILITVTN